jgi:hypothetical protein
MDKVTKKLFSCGKEQKNTAVATDIGKSRIKIIGPVSTEIYRSRETEREKEWDGGVNMVEGYMKNKEVREPKTLGNERD